MDRVDDFIKACQHGRMDDVLMFLNSSESIDVNCTDEHFNTALQVAAANGKEAVVTLLLQNGALVDKRNSYGWTPLMQAARQGHANVMNILICHGANVNAVSKFKFTGSTALLCAVRSGVLSCVKLLLEHGAVPSPLFSELTPLIVAAQYNYTSIVKHLIDAGLNVNQMTSPAGLNALMFAASNGHKGTAQLLVECGANLFAVNGLGQNALDIAIVRGKKQVRCYLSENMINSNPDLSNQEKPDIFEAITNGNLQVVRQLLVTCPSLINKAHTLDGTMPLSLAVILGDFCIVKYLLANGALIDAQDSNGWTPLMHAVFRGYNEVALFLLKNGADRNRKENNGYCALEIGTLVASSDVNLLRCLTPLYSNGSQTMLKKLSLAHLDYDSSEVKQKLWNQLGGHFMQQKVKMAEARQSKAGETIGLAPFGASKNFKSPFQEANNHGHASRVFDEFICIDSHYRNNTKNSIENLLFCLNTASPCRLAPPSKLLLPIVLPLLSPYGLDTSNPGRTVMPDVLDLPECFSMVLPHKFSSNKKSHSLDSVYDECAVPSQIISGSEPISTIKDELYDILEHLSLEKYYSLFDEQEVDTSAFALLTEQDLIVLGIDDIVSRQKLMAAISLLKNTST